MSLASPRPAEPVDDYLRRITVSGELDEHVAGIIDGRPRTTWRLGVPVKDFVRAAMKIAYWKICARWENKERDDIDDAVAQASVIKDTTTKTFVKDIVEESKRQPVLAYFWAKWCGPCKRLAPVLETVVRSANGRVKLRKMDIDKHPSIPGQLGIKSIPAVFAFVNGQPVDGFLGAMSEIQISMFIERLIKNRITSNCGTSELQAMDEGESISKKIDRLMDEVGHIQLFTIRDTQLVFVDWQKAADSFKRLRQEAAAGRLKQRVNSPEEQQRILQDLMQIKKEVAEKVGKTETLKIMQLTLGGVIRATDKGWSQDRILTIVRRGMLALRITANKEGAEMLWNASPSDIECTYQQRTKNFYDLIGRILRGETDQYK